MYFNLLITRTIAVALFNGILITIIIFIKKKISYKNIQFYDIKRVRKMGLKRNNFYFDDIPFDGDILCAFQAMKSLESPVTMYNLISSYFLKWHYEGFIEIYKIRNNYTVFRIGKKFKSKNLYEIEVYKKMISGMNEYGEIIYEDLKKSFNNMIYTNEDNYANEQLRILGYAETSDSKIKVNGKYVKKINYTKKGSIELQKLLGLKNYLNDFMNLEEKDLLSVKMWEEYVVFANLFNLPINIISQFTYKNI